MKILNLKKLALVLVGLFGFASTGFCADVDPSEYSKLIGDFVKTKSSCA